MRSNAPCGVFRKGWPWCFPSTPNQVPAGQSNQIAMPRWASLYVFCLRKHQSASVYPSETGRANWPLCLVFPKGRIKGVKANCQTESTDKDVMKGKDRLGDGSANWQFASLDQRPLCMAQAISSVAQPRSMSDRGSGANCQFALPFRSPLSLKCSSSKG